MTKSFQNFGAHLREQKEKVVSTVLHAAKTITIENAIKVFGISRATFQTWLVQVKFKCENSVFSFCRKQYPNQLRPGEVETMKSLLTDPEFKHWPIVSLCYYAIRKGLLP
ncbi:MAG: hypothetical protein OEW75_13225 [Cyclobacteriaceae bacterium]|nr:hypothetical protein [Cyclobacteriaceae bacterium]